MTDKTVYVRQAADFARTSHYEWSFNATTGYQVFNSASAAEAMLVTFVGHAVTFQFVLPPSNTQSIEFSLDGSTNKVRLTQSVQSSASVTVPAPTQSAPQQSKKVFMGSYGGYVGVSNTGGE